MHTLLTFLSGQPSRPNPDGPGRCVACTHPEAARIARVVARVTALADTAHHDAVRALVLRGGGPDIERAPLEDYDRYVDSDDVRERALEYVHAALDDLDARGPLEGMPLFGMGVTRAVFGLSPTEVLKVSFWPHDDPQSGRELGCWENASEEDASWLCPILAAGHGWSVMALAQPFEEGRGPDGRRLRDFRGRTRDPDEANLGILQGRTVLVDYGL